MKTQTYAFDSVWPRLGLFGLILALALAIPAFGWPQAVTGTLVNALLLLTVELLGVGPAIALGAMTPLAGLMHGVLPLPMAVMIPFIMLGNATLVSLYAALRSHTGSWRSASRRSPRSRCCTRRSRCWRCGRSIWRCWRASRPVAMPAALVAMMSWPQLVTAVAGGLLAFAILRLRK